MMANYKCSDCSDAFDRQELHQIPRILFCGHTFCSKCIKNLLQCSKTCPICKQEMPEKSCKEFPINNSLLEIIETKNDISSSSWDDTIFMYSRNVRSLQQEYSILKNVLESQKEKNDKFLSLIENGEEKLNSMIEKDTILSSASRDDVKSLKTQLDKLKIQSEIVTQCEVLRNDESVTISLWSTNFDSIESYLAKINKGIWNNKRFAAVLKFGDVTKYAKLSIHEDFLLIHAFEKQTPDSQLFTVCYKDLLSSLQNNQDGNTCNTLSSTPKMNLPVYCFFDLPVGSICRPQRIFIEVIKSHFLQLCTGECGYSYKGCDFEITLENDITITGSTNAKGNRILRVKTTTKASSQKIVESASKYFAVCEKKVLNRNEDRPNYCLQLDANDSFEIIHVTFPYFPHSRTYGTLPPVPGIAGAVIDPKLLSVFQYGETGMVLDCGIAIKMITK